ncbi:hypothetical protein [Streptomyces mirabilis]
MLRLQIGKHLDVEFSIYLSPRALTILTAVGASIAGGTWGIVQK